MSEQQSGVVALLKGLESTLRQIMFLLVLHRKFAACEEVW